MKLYTQNLLIGLLLGICLSPLSLLHGQTEMDNKRLEKIIRSEGTEIKGRTGAWEFTYGKRAVIILTDEANNRMRIMSPVIEEKEVKKQQFKEMLEANFDRALDAKYSLYNGYVISVFTHPLKELQEAQFIDAMQQVVVLAYTFGTTYTSTNLVFGDQEEGSGN